MSEEELRELRRRLLAAVDPLCPRCGRRRVPPSSSTGWCAECDAREFRKREEKRRWLRSSRMYQTEVDEMYALREKVANPGAPMSEGETYRLLALEEKARRLGILEEGGHAE